MVAWAEGNILLGGDGNDTFEGRGADDFIHGDAWLNVRLSIRELDNDGNVLEGTEAFTVDSPHGHGDDWRRDEAAVELPAGRRHQA
ncbi:hypothetical protein HSBAA_21790 [Vreelandella sulfidaeris]|uniref:Peptidase M10 serralysin C-terminal domain-containing protein n=1 Tax=Vreelandella sulfidaeris TaxID=115553 RepID=A0A455U6Q1_9GAMM|nr:hypothetical protein HSBAA_21790 [Halomonas sulfidaeris]